MNMASAAARQAEQRELLVRVADQLASRRLTTPGIFLLESCKPLSFILSQALIFSEPVIQPLFSIQDFRLFAEALEDRDNIEFLLQELEQEREGTR
jgi:hypothetical protein